MLGHITTKNTQQIVFKVKIKQVMVFVKEMHTLSTVGRKGVVENTAS